MKISRSDKIATQDIKLAGDLLHIKVLDHIVLTKDAYVSFADENIL